MDTESMTRRWDDRWPDAQPIGHTLRESLRSSWVRFHSLPESRRYPDNETDFVEILRRHRTVLNELADGTPDSETDVLVMTCSGSMDPTPELRHTDLDWLPADYWVTTQDYEHDPWIHVYVSTLNVDSSQMERLLSMVAVDETSGVIIADKNLTWLYHPYDGGADVIAPSTPFRDALAVIHRPWLSELPSGL